MPLKYIFISGGVISGIGKGTTAASVALLLKSAGYRVAPIKFENYLNIDAGTINPIEHGDPFLCEDGTEADMDIGTYEKYLSEDMGKENFVTMGQIYRTVIDRERRFEYMGEDVEAIPYITDEIVKRIKNVASKRKADIVTIELGGTAGEYQNVFYYEASRMLTLKYPGDVIHIHVSYVPTPKHLGEPKTKPTQLSIRTLNSMGIQPDFIIARSEQFIDKRRRDRFALFCNIHPDDIISNPDAKTVYEIPLILHEQDLETKILKKLHLPVRKAHLAEWEKLFLRVTKKPSGSPINLSIVGKYFGTGDYQLRDSYAALFDAIDHASWQKNVKVNTHWLDAEKIESYIKSEKNNKNEALYELLGKTDGIIVPIGWGIRGSEGMIAAANYARENKIPYLGLCYGMQLAVVAFARNVLGWKDADTTENNKKTKHPVIHLMPAQEKYMRRRAYGGTMRLGAWNATVKPDTLAYEIYDTYDSWISKSKRTTSERHRHRWEFNNRFIKEFDRAGLIISAYSEIEHLAEIVELPKQDHPFYLGTQGHPEYKSRPLNPHPVFLSFIEACQKNKTKRVSL